MLGRYLSFVRGLSANRLGRIGVILTTSSLITFLLLQLATLLGMITNAYAGLLIYLVLPTLFVIGLVLIPIGWYLLRRQTGMSTADLLRERFADDELQGGRFGSKIIQTVAVLTLVNLVFLGSVSISALHFMDSARFCGTACHSVMNPEWVTYQSSPHARVACVDCHVGEGASALVSSKLRGAYQMISVTFDLLERPIPTPVHSLRPARETCERCHWPDKFYGTQIETRVRFGEDRENTPSYTTLALKIDAGKRGTESGVHWHIGEENLVRYASSGDERQEMIWVEVERADGSVRRYTNRRLIGSAEKSSEVRTVDCIDCHNRATHIYQDPVDAVDEALELGRIDREIPFIRREALRALRVEYPSAEEASHRIRSALVAFYRREAPHDLPRISSGIDEAASQLVAIWQRNVHPGMRIGWGAYRSHIGHRTPGYGCFRCHSEDLVDAEGEHVPDDCTLCHSILANDSADRFQYLREPKENARDRAMHLYLQEEFLSQSEMP